MIVAIMALALCQEVSPPAPKPDTPAVVAESRTGNKETLHFGTDRKVTGIVLKETADHVFVDVGFDVLRVPIASIVRREVEEKSVQGVVESLTVRETLVAWL